MIQLFTSIQEAKKLIPPSRISPHGQGDAQSASDEPGISLDNLCYGLRSNQGREGIVPPIHPPIAETEQTKCYRSLQQLG